MASFDAAAEVGDGPDYDSTDLLAEFLGACEGLKVSFSVNCVSGLVGREICQCWRCRGVEPEDEHQGWARAAKLISRGHSAQVAFDLRLARFRRDCPVCSNDGKAPRCPGCGRDPDGILPPREVDS